MSFFFWSFISSERVTQQRQELIPAEDRVEGEDVIEPPTELSGTHLSYALHKCLGLRKVESGFVEAQ